MPYKSGDPERGRTLLDLRAGQCHTFGKGEPNGIGPNLYGIIGRVSGRVPGYAYSRANASAKVLWSQDELDIYLTNPSKYMPGTRMAFAGIRRDKDRADIIAYLETLIE
eukprot:TRINITY_DN32708_c0_g1_i1.p2 TRINITY_DN32708_c0_g1~~TRINITY_DN32708_c0_g1_i1.p2  ORF type:complete len:109 (+),score=13.36 TRINITY_DN32708_c0_g1_i1:27-353(+)